MLRCPYMHYRADCGACSFSSSPSGRAAGPSSFPEGPSSPQPGGEDENVTSGVVPALDGFFSFAFSPLTCYTVSVVIPIPATEGGEHVDFILSLFVTVVGGVACHYIIRWLDRDDHE